MSSDQQLSDKYRPKRISQMAGNKSELATVEGMFKSKNTRKSFLITGAWGCGKTTLARIIAKQFNCTASSGKKPCGKCDSCKMSIENHPDITEMDAAADNGVAVARDLKLRETSKPFYGGKRVFILDESAPYEGKISTDLGQIEIGTIVDNKMDVKVWSESSTGKLELKPITSFFKRRPKSPMKKVVFDDGSGMLKSTKLTALHQVLTSKGDTCVKDLLQGDTLFLKENSDLVSYINETEEARSADSNEKESKGFNSRIDARGCLHTSSISECYGENIFRTRTEAKEISEEKIQYLKVVGGDTAEEREEWRIWEVVPSFLYFAEKRTPEVQETILPEGKENYTSKSDKKPNCETGSLVVDGRREQQRKINNPTHRKFCSKRSCVSNENPNKKRVRVQGILSKRETTNHIHKNWVTQFCKMGRALHLFRNALQSKSFPRRTGKSSVSCLWKKPHKDLGGNRLSKILQIKTLPICKNPNGKIKGTNSERTMDSERNAFLSFQKIMCCMLNKVKNFSSSKACLLQKVCGNSLLEKRYKKETREVKVVRIEDTITPEFVYDLEVKDNHNFFIDGVLAHNSHRLTQAAWGALLKVVEEPHSVFIFVTTESGAIPNTIRSRCLDIHLEPVKPKAIAKYLAKVCEKENIDVDKKTLIKIAKASDGHMRDAISILEKLWYRLEIHDDKKVDIKKVIREALRQSPYKIVESYIDAILKSDESTAMNIIKDLVEFPYFIKAISESMTKFALYLASPSAVDGSSRIRFDEKFKLINEKDNDIGDDMKLLMSYAILNLVSKANEDYKTYLQPAQTVMARMTAGLLLISRGILCSGRTGQEL